MAGRAGAGRCAASQTPPPRTAQAPARGIGLSVSFLGVLLLAGFTQAGVNDAIPQAREMPAPDWVKPGVRLTWWAASAGRTGNFATPNAHFGKSEDQRGNKFTLTRGGATAGSGYTELTIVAVEPKRVVWEFRQYVLPGTAKGPATMLAVAGGVCDTPGSLNGYWIHPTVLRSLLAKPAGFTVGEFKHNVNGRTYDAIQIAMKSAKAQFRWTYDLESGVLLGHHHGQRGTRGVGGRGTDGTDYSGKTWGATALEFRERAHLELPWLAAPMPAWAGRMKRMEFAGGSQMMAAGGMTMPQSQRFESLRVARTWVMMRRTMVSGPRSWLNGGTVHGAQIHLIQGPFVTGVGSPSGLWIQPSVLQKLTRGQEISASPVTEFRVTVAHVGPDRGADICILRWANRLQSIDYVYDRKTGRLVRMSRDNRYVGRKDWYTFEASP